jgi:hypothetical protein
MGCDGIQYVGSLSMFRRNVLLSAALVYLHNLENLCTEKSEKAVKVWLESTKRLTIN